MTNILSIWLGALVLGFCAIDYFLMDWSMILFLGRRFLELTEYVAFWR